MRGKQLVLGCYAVAWMELNPQPSSYKAELFPLSHGPLSSSMRSNDDNDWPVHSLMLFLHDLRGLHLRR